jgi:hypothetical protein
MCTLLRYQMKTKQIIDQINKPQRLVLALIIASVFAAIGVSLLHLSRAASTPPGDLNGDGVINVFDLSIFLSHWNQSGSGLAEDFNNDGNVNVFDLSIMLSNYGKSVSNSNGGYTGVCDKTINPSTTSGAIAAAESGMSPGQVLCLNSGMYGSVSGLNKYTTSGSSGKPITITSGPGQTATIVGAEYVNAGYLVFEYLNIDDSNNQYSSNGGSDPAPCSVPVSESFDLNASNNILQYNNIYQATASLRGVLIGIGYGGAVDNTVIRYNKISDAGSCNQTQHLIYNDHGSGTQIYDNWMWNDHYGYGVQLYSSPSNTKVYSNVIDNVLDGTVEATSGSGNQTYNNVFMNATIMSGFHSGYVINCLNAGGDTVDNNASWHNPNGLGAPCSGVTATGNLTLSADPFVNSAAHNYTLSASAPAALQAYNLWDGTGPLSPDPAP